MKTTFKTLTNQREATKKRAIFERKTGLKWQWYSTGNGIRFTPVVTKNTPIENEAANALFLHLTTEYRSFVNLAEASGLALSDVLIGAKTLVRQEKAVGTVNRTGGFSAVRSKYNWEIK